MDAKEIIAYIETNHLEYQMVSIMMFNTCGFAFLPVVNPRLVLHDQDRLEVIGFNEINLFSNSSRTFTFPVTDEILSFKNLNRFLFHPEDIQAYIIRQGDIVGVEMMYSRKRDRVRLIRNAAFETFIAYNNIDTIEQFNNLYVHSKTVRMEKYKKGLSPNFSYDRLLIDDAISASIELAGEKTKRVFDAFKIRLAYAQNEIFNNRYAPTGFSVDLSDSISFSAEFKAIAPIRTVLERPISIVDDRDEIPDILYKLAYELQATELFIATGYMYESGLLRLLSAFSCMDNNTGCSVELIVGELYHYTQGKRCKSPNRATINALNSLMETGVVNRVYTYPSRFYHGKYYYISNGMISYIIMGSSNVTVSAYKKNKEFDVIYRFDRNNGIDPLEQDFLNWYSTLKKDCVKLDVIDERMFPSNLSIDEEGTSYGNTLLKRITDEEERNRFVFLEGYSPSRIEENAFKGKYYRPFRDYMLFIYQEQGVCVLEGFSYGNSCYVFGTTNVEILKHQIAMKSKERVRQSDLFITDIPHDDRYKDEIARILSVN